MHALVVLATYLNTTYFHKNKDKAAGQELSVLVLWLKLNQLQSS
jgi:hypothetical protein